jgi:hypothetical protein
MRSDLCVGELDGRMRIIRPDIDGGISHAVAPDGTAVRSVRTASSR